MEDNKGITALEFYGLPADVHHCTAHRDGEEIVWRCPLCEGYERRLNVNTGAMTAKGKTGAMHTGCSTRAQNMEGLTKNLSKQ